MREKIRNFIVSKPNYQSFEIVGLCLIFAISVYNLFIGPQSTTVEITASIISAVIFGIYGIELWALKRRTFLYVLCFIGAILNIFTVVSHMIV